MSKTDISGEFMALMNRFRMMKHRHVKSFGVAPAEFMMLVTICQNEEIEDGQKGTKISKVAETMDSSISACSKLAKILEEKQMIKRVVSRRDRRITYLSLTERGETYLERANVLRLKLTRRMEEEIGIEKLQSLLQTMDQIYQIIMEEMEAC